MNTASTGGDEPRWLTDEEQRTWRAYLHATTLLEDHLDRQLQRDAGMPHIYYGLLVQLSQAPRRRLRMTELAMDAKITRSRLSHADRPAGEERLGAPRGLPLRQARAERGADGRGLRDAARRPRPAMSTPYARRCSTGSRPSRSEQLGEIMRIIAEGLQPQDSGADLPWLR